MDDPSTPPYPTRFAEPGRPPRAAAAVILLRQGTGEVFLVRRSPKLRFLGGFGGYPGGRVDAQDATLAGAGDRLHPAAMEIAAARELFEEAGILLLPGADAVDDDALDRGRRDLLDRRVDFAGLCRRLGLEPRPAPGALIPAGRWVTPHYSPLRFETRYFVHVHRGARQPSVWPGELVNGAWTAPEEVLRRWHAWQTWLAPPVTETLQVLAGGTVPVRELAERLEERARRRGHPFHPVRMRHGIRMLSLLSRTLPPSNFVNVYLVGEEELAVVDPGAAPGEPREILVRELRRLRRRGHRLAMTVLTHHHLDHVDGAEEVRRLFGTPIAAHPSTAAALRGAARVVHGARVPALEVDVELDDGQRIDLAGGFALRALATPGHAPGHLCLLEERSGSLLAGDLVSGLSPVIIDPPEGDMGAYLDTLRSMIALGDHGLFPGHGPPALSSRDRLELLLRHRLWRRDRIAAALRQAGRGLTEDRLLEMAYADVASHLRPLASRSLLAHLLDLRSHGQALRGEDGRWRAPLPAG